MTIIGHMQILVDANNVSFREGHAKAGLSHEGQPTGVIYGFLQQLRILSQRFPGDVCLCWDSKENLRKQFFPNYKANRGNGKNGMDDAMRSDILLQMALLRTELLPRIGYGNNFLMDGYEADDLIASLCRKLSGQKIVISSDTDLYQLLGPFTSIYRLGKKDIYTYKSLMDEFDVTPRQWVEVKSLAGDSSDNIPGIEGVGIKTAVKLVLGKPVNQRVWNNFKEFKYLERNRKLIKLPWEGLELSGEVVKSSFNEREFMRVCGEFGLNSLM